MKIVSRSVTSSIGVVGYASRVVGSFHIRSPVSKVANKSLVTRSLPLIRRKYTKTNTRLYASPPEATPSTTIQTTLDTPAFRIYLPVVIVLSILMLIDAAYSGDWSRIGVLTKEQEDILKSFVPIAVGGHALIAVAAGVVSSQRGENWVPRAIKTFGGGIVSLIEVIYFPENETAGSGGKGK